VSDMLRPLPILGRNFDATDEVAGDIRATVLPVSAAAAGWEDADAASRVLSDDSFSSGNESSPGGFRKRHSASSPFHLRADKKPLQVPKEPAGSRHCRPSSSPPSSNMLFRGMGRGTRNFDATDEVAGHVRATVLPVSAAAAGWEDADAASRVLSDDSFSSGNESSPGGFRKRHSASSPFHLRADKKPLQVPKEPAGIRHCRPSSSPPSSSMSLPGMGRGTRVWYPSSETAVGQPLPEFYWNFDTAGEQDCRGIGHGAWCSLPFDQPAVGQPLFSVPACHNAALSSPASRDRGFGLRRDRASNEASLPGWQGRGVGSRRGRANHDTAWSSPVLRSYGWRAHPRPSRRTEAIQPASDRCQLTVASGVVHNRSADTSAGLVQLQSEANAAAAAEDSWSDIAQRPCVTRRTGLSQEGQIHALSAASGDSSRAGNSKWHLMFRNSMQSKDSAGLSRLEPGVNVAAAEEDSSSNIERRDVQQLNSTRDGQVPSMSSAADGGSSPAAEQWWLPWPECVLPTEFLPPREPSASGREADKQSISDTRESAGMSSAAGASAAGRDLSSVCRPKVVHQDGCLLIVHEDSNDTNVLSHTGAPVDTTEDLMQFEPPTRCVHHTVHWFFTTISS